MSTTGDDTKVMKTYVPPGQKQEWVEHAEELGMTQSEYLRTMVQAGRRGFTVQSPVGPRSVESGSVDGGGELIDRVRLVLAEQGALDWDELVSELTSTVEEELDDVLETLQEENEVRYSGRAGGYQLAGESAGEEV